MKKQHLLTLFGLLTAVGTPLAAAEIPNPGFELSTNTQLQGWTMSDAENSQSRWEIAANAAYGKNLRIHKTNHEGYVTLKSERIAVTPRTQYEVSTRYRVAGLSRANVYYMINQQKAAGDKTRAPNVSSWVTPVYSTDGNWDELKWTFSTAEGVESVQISLIISQAPIDISFDDVRLQSIAAEAYKPRYEAPTPETLFSQEEAGKILQDRPRATAEMKTVGQRPRLFVNGREKVPYIYKGPGAWKFNRAQIKDFGQAGVNIYLIPLSLGRGVYQRTPTGVWLGKDKLDFAELDELMWRVLRADPNGYVMFQLATDPYPTWGAEHPDDVVINEHGEKAIVGGHALRFGGEPKPTQDSYAERYGYSYVSQRLREDTTNVLKQVDEHIKNSLPGKAVIGYFLGGGDDGQLFAWGDRSDQLTDYSPAAQFAFRGWLQRKYKSNDALQKAWHMPAATLDTAQVPEATRRLKSTYFLDPETEQDILDYRRFHSEGTVDSLNIYATALREAHGTPIVIGCYYAGPTIGVTSHRATEHLLKGGQYNFITSVLAYNAVRALGNPGKAHQAWSSLLLHNAIGLAEEDYRSWKSVPTTKARDEQLVARVQTAAESNAMVRRDTGRQLANGNGVWWYDMEGGWFNDPTIMKAIDESVKASQRDFANNEAPIAQVAVFTDEYSLDSINHLNTRANRNAISQQIIEMKSSGVPFHTYLQNDLADAKLPDYKLYVFLNPYHLEPQVWQAMQKLRRDGKTLAFMHAPGIMNGSLLEAPTTAGRIAKVTGIAVEENGEQSLGLLPAGASPFSDNGIVSFSSMKAPSFTVTDNLATTYANYKENGKAAVALRDFGTWKSLFFGGMGMDAVFFNALARQAGAWVAAPAGNAVFASQNFLTIHAMHDGEKTIQLLRPSKVTDLANNTVVSQNTPTLTLPMKRGETRWFSLEKP